MSDDRPAIEIVYDGECPFCSSYAQLVRLREAAGPVELIDARSDHPTVAEVRRRGLSLDEGMVMRIGEEYLHGAAVLTRIARLTDQRNAWDRAQAWLFGSEARARRLYPALRFGRNLTLRLLGRRPIAPKSR